MTFTPTATRTGDPTTCFCCGRQAAPIGIGGQHEPKYLCHQCLDIVESIVRVKRFTPYEYNAIAEAGEKAGEYLDSINKTDLAELEQEEWRVFCRIMIEEFGNALRKQIVNGEAPF